MCLFCFFSSVYSCSSHDTAPCFYPALLIGDYPSGWLDSLGIPQCPATNPPASKLGGLKPGNNLEDDDDDDHFEEFEEFEEEDDDPPLVHRVVKPPAKPTKHTNAEILAAVDATAKQLSAVTMTEPNQIPIVACDPTPAWTKDMVDQEWVNVTAVIAFLPAGASFSNYIIEAKEDDHRKNTKYEAKTMSAPEMSNAANFLANTNVKKKNPVLLANMQNSLQALLDKLPKDSDGNIIYKGSGDFQCEVKPAPIPLHKLWLATSDSDETRLHMCVKMDEETSIDHAESYVIVVFFQQELGFKSPAKKLGKLRKPTNKQPTPSPPPSPEAGNKCSRNDAGPGFIHSMWNNDYNEG